jgi:hypothetical protein
MALYEVELDGAVYEVEGPDDREPTEGEVRSLLGPSSSSAAPVEQPKSNLEGFAEHFAPTALVKGAFDSAKEYFDPAQYKGIIDNPIVGNIPLAVVPGTSIRGMQAAKQGIDKSAQEIGSGNYARGGVDFAKVLTPAAAPLEAGLNLYEGKPGATGEVVGELANLALPYAAKGVAKGLAGTEATRAAKWVEGINPKAPVKGLAEKIAPRALEEGIWGTEEGMKAYVEAERPGAYKALSDAWENSPIDQFNIDPIKTALQAEIKKLSLGNEGVPATPTAQNAISAFQDRIARLEAISNEGLVGKNDFRSLRQQWDTDVNWLRDSKRKNNNLTPEQTVQAEASKAAADAERGMISDLTPEIANANSKVSFLENLESVLQNRKQPSNKFFSTLAGIAGLNEGGIPKAGMYAATAKIAHALLTSPVYKTLSAVQRAKLAKVLNGAQARYERPRETEINSGGQLPGARYEGHPAELTQLGEYKRLPDVFEGAPVVDDALRQALMNTDDMPLLEREPLNFGSELPETPFARAQRFGQTGELPQVWEQGQSFDDSLRQLELNTNPNPGLLEAQGFQEGFNPGSSPFQDIQRFSTGAEGLATPTLNSILEQALIDQLLLEAKRGR